MLLPLSLVDERTGQPRKLQSGDVLVLYRDGHAKFGDGKGGRLKWRLGTGFKDDKHHFALLVCEDPDMQGNLFDELATIIAASHGLQVRRSQEWPDSVQYTFFS